MDSVLSWVKQIVIFYIFSNFIIHILPNSNYQKYIKFFIGLILIVVVLNPLAGMLNLNSVFDKIYDLTISNNSMLQMKADLQYAQKTSYDSIVEPYRKEITRNVEEIVLSNKLYPAKTAVEMDLDSESETFGQIKTITCKVSEKYTQEGKIAIDEVRVRVGEDSEQGQTEKLSPKAVQIKNEIAEFYQIPVEHIIITE